MGASHNPTLQGSLKLFVGIRAVRVIVPPVIAALAVGVLHALAARVQWTDVRADLAAASGISLLGALGFTALSFAGISLYDPLALRAVAPGKVPFRIAAPAGAGGNAVSGLLGVSYLTGTAVRARVYSGFGLDMTAIACVIALSWSGFICGLALVVGGVMTFHPESLGAALPVPPWVETATGLALLLVLAAYLAWLATGARHLRAGGVSLALPRAGTGLALTLAGVLDLVGAALALYMLMPGDVAASLPFFFAIFFGAVVLGTLSHSPGGLGVFEATIIAGMGSTGRSDVVAALLLYRLIYTILPFALAAGGLAAVMGMAHRRQLTGGARTLWRSFAPIVPSVAAGIALLAGVVLLISGNLPAEHSRLAPLRALLPLSFIEASHLAGSIAGLLLIVVARGLNRKLHRAWIAAMALLVIGLVASLAKGLDWEEAVWMLATLGVLGLFRPAFYRAESGALLRLSLPWLVSLAMLIAATTWIGLFAHSLVAYRNDLWWEFTWQGDASRFLRASLAVAVVLGCVAVNSLVGARPSRTGPQPIPEAVRRLVAESRDAEAALALTGDKAFLLDENERAFIAYADTGRSLIARGDPVGDPEAGKRLVWRLREMADRQGRSCAFYAVSSAFLPTYLDLGLSVLKIGEVARVDLRGFTLAGSARKGVRQARNRAARDGYAFEVVRAGHAGPVMAGLRRVSDAWLARKQGKEKGFALGAFEEGYIASFDTAILRAPGGGIAAFANLFQAADRAELSLDLMRHDPEAPGFVMDALFAELLLWGVANGYRRFSLGAAPFSGIENRPFAPVWNRIGGFVYEHGEHFYNFEGLRAFKEKFDPEWSPSYLACPGRLAAPRILYEVNLLISGGLRGLMN